MRRTILAFVALTLAPTAMALDAPAVPGPDDRAPGPGGAGPRFELRPGERYFRVEAAGPLIHPAAAAGRRDAPQHAESHPGSSMRPFRLARAAPQCYPMLLKVTLPEAPKRRHY